MTSRPLPPGRVRWRETKRGPEAKEPGDPKQRSMHWGAARACWVGFLGKEYDWDQCISDVSPTGRLGSIWYERPWSFNPSDFEFWQQRHAGLILGRCCVTKVRDRRVYMPAIDALLSVDRVYLRRLSEMRLQLGENERAKMEHDHRASVHVAYRSPSTSHSAQVRCAS